MKIEVKSISSGKAIRLSSIMGWAENQLPKVLIIFHCSKLKAPPISRPDGTQTKARDIEVTIDDYSVHYRDVSKYFVQWTDKFRLMKRQSQMEGKPKFSTTIRNGRRMQSSLAAPIKLRAEKNGENCRIHYGLAIFNSPALQEMRRN